MSSQEQSTSGAPEVPWTLPNGIEATYNLHCHCGAIRYNMTLSPPLYAEETQGQQQCVAVECNCSYCERNGYLSVHPLAKDVEFTRGLEHRVEYLTSSKKSPHWFCGKCGSVLGTDSTWVMTEVLHDEPRYSINIRMLKDFDPERIKVRQLKFMKHFGPKYELS